MKISMIDKHTRIYAIILGIVLVFMIIMDTYISPTMSIRRYLLKDGHIVSAVFSKIEFNQLQNDLEESTLEDENAEIYTVEYINIINSDKDNKDNFKVIKDGYFCEAERL